MAKVVGAYKTGNANMAVRESNRHSEGRYERLRFAVQNSGGRDVIADKTGIGKTTLTQYMKEGDWKLSLLEKIALACGTSVSWLVDGEALLRADNIVRGDTVTTTTLSDANVLVSPERDGTYRTTMNIPGYDVELSAGHGFSPSSAIEQVSFSISGEGFPPELLRPHHKLVGLRARGDSMEPYICSGDILVVDLNDHDIFTGGIYALRVHDQLLVKRLSLRANGNLSVISDNPRYPTDEIEVSQMRQMAEDGGAPLAIIGRVVWRMGMTLS